MNEENFAQILKMMNAFRSSDISEIIRYLPGVGENKSMLTIMKLLPRLMGKGGGEFFRGDGGLDEEIYRLDCSK